MGDILLGVVNAIAVIALAAITYWYARSTSRMLAQMQAQAEATAQQAEATQATLDLIRRAALPEWDISFVDTSSMRSCSSGMSCAAR